MRKLLLLMCGLLLSGCTTRLTDFTVISTKNIDLTRGSEFTRMNSRVEGEDRKHIIVIFPTGEPNAKEATDKAIESTSGTIALLDGVLESEFFYFPYIVVTDMPLIGTGGRIALGGVVGASSRSASPIPPFS